MNNPEIYSDNNHISLTTILRAIKFSQNQFSLLFLRCNYSKLQQEIVKELQKISPVPIREISVNTSTKSLQSQISEELINEQPQALMIFGLDTVENIESFLKSANQSREEFRKNFPFPVLIWIDDQMLKTIIRIAPDLENWGSVIDFEYDNDDLIDLLQETTEEIFNHDVIVTPQVYKEITSANQDLQKRGQEIDPQIQAKLQFVLGLTEYQRNNLDLALNYYQSSLNFWQDNNNLESQGIVLVKIALAYVKHTRKKLRVERETLEQEVKVITKKLKIGETQVTEAQQEVTQKITELNHLNTSLNQAQIQLGDIQEDMANTWGNVLVGIEKQTGQKSAIIYVNFIDTRANIENTYLSIWMVTAKGQVQKHTTKITRSELIKDTRYFRRGVTSRELNRKIIMLSSQKLYQIIIAPLEADLKKKNINDLVFILDSDLRSLPLAALHDRHQYLVEKYSGSSRLDMIN